MAGNERRGQNSEALAIGDHAVTRTRGMRWAAVCLLLLCAPASAQSKHSGLPFQVGEKAQYRVAYGIIGRVGSGSLEVLSQDTVRGRPTYRLVFALRGGIPGARINN